MQLGHFFVKTCQWLPCVLLAVVLSDKEVQKQRNDFSIGELSLCALLDEIVLSLCVSLFTCFPVNAHRNGLVGIGKDCVHDTTLISSLSEKVHCLPLFIHRQLSFRPRTAPDPFCLGSVAGGAELSVMALGV